MHTDELSAQVRTTRMECGVLDCIIDGSGSAPSQNQGARSKHRPPLQELPRSRSTHLRDGSSMGRASQRPGQQYSCDCIAFGLALNAPPTATAYDLLPVDHSMRPNDGLRVDRHALAVDVPFNASAR